MELFDRIYALDGLLKNSKHPVALTRIMQELECAKATAKRTIHRMRLYLYAPIEYDRKRNGYYYNNREGEHPYELPGLWFNTSELHALLTAETLLEQVDPGIYQHQLKPLKKRIENLLDQTGEPHQESKRRIRILAIAQRRFNNHIFRHLATATLQRKQLIIEYQGRSQNDNVTRTVSPQRLVHYRYNWYLDAWCHLRKAFRSFAVERIIHTQITNKKARNFSEKALDDYFASAFGIFSGEATDTAILHFTPERAQWVAEEQWHPQQQGQWLDNGAFELRIPYGNPTELIMDILKYGNDVEVIAPASLRQEIINKIKQMEKIYK